MPSVATPALLDSLLGNSCQPQADRSSELSIFKAALISRCRTSLTCLCGVVKEFCWRPSISYRPPALFLYGYNYLRELLLYYFKRRWVSFHLLRVLHEMCYALSTVHNEGLLPELSGHFDTCQLCLHLFLTLCFWTSTAAVLPSLHSVCPSSMRAGATSLTKLLVIPSFGSAKDLPVPRFSLSLLLSLFHLRECCIQRERVIHSLSRRAGLVALVLLQVTLQFQGKLHFQGKLPILWFHVKLHL